jgi:CRISPR-associated protein Cmr4
MSLPSQASAILGLYAQTSIHAGTGQSTGAVDLPIQREAHAGWPCVFGSGLKGALRTDAESRGMPPTEITRIYGPDTDNADDHAGSIAVTDARLLLLPVRSLTSHFKWVTCPAILKRLQRDLARLGKFSWAAFLLPPEPNEEEALVSQGGNALYLEEYRYSERPEDLKGMIDCLKHLIGADIEEALRQQLTLVSNDQFAHLCQSATPINAHVRLNSDTKTVDKGALWYEETLPPETVLYAGVVASKARKKDDHTTAKDVLAQVMKQGPHIQIGGNETVGMGWCAALWIASEEE